MRSPSFTQEVIEELKRREQAKEKLQKKKLIKEKAEEWGFSPKTIEKEIWPKEKSLQNRLKTSTPGLNRTNENIGEGAGPRNPALSFPTPGRICLTSSKG